MIAAVFLVLIVASSIARPVDYAPSDDEHGVVRRAAQTPPPGVQVDWIDDRPRRPQLSPPPPHPNVAKREARHEDPPPGVQVDWIDDRPHRPQPPLPPPHPN